MLPFIKYIGALTKKMMLNKELLQGELPTDASSTVSVVMNSLTI